MTRSRSKEEYLRAIIITIDGPSGSGKTTTARAVARRLGVRHLDTGAMYRAVTLKAIREGGDVDDERAMGALAAGCHIEFRGGDDGPQEVLLDGEDVSQSIRGPEVTRWVSHVSAHRLVRRAMVRRQRALADRGGVVLEGRDTGSVVLPHANPKIFLDASLDVRAERRRRELAARGVAPDMRDVQESLRERDLKDSTREVSPLKKPVGALTIDTTSLKIEDQVAAVIDAAEATAEALAAPVTDPAHRARRRTAYFAGSQAFIRWVYRLLWGLRVFRKRRYLRHENYIYASNHRSNADPTAVGCTINRNVHFVAKESLFRNRIFGGIIRSVNAFPIKRGVFDRTAMNYSLEMLSRGDSILIFPEGGRHPGPELGPPRPGVGFVALKSGRPVVPVYVDGTARVRSRLFRFGGITVRHGHPLRLTDPNLAKYQTADDFREFGAMVMEAIQALKDEQDASA